MAAQDRESIESPPESAVRALGAEILRRASSGKPGLFDSRSWESGLLDWAMQDDGFKTDLFRFLDVLPTLTSDSLVARHVKEYLLRDGRTLPGPMTAALKAAGGGLLSGVAARAIRSLAARLGKRFICAGSVDKALPVLRRMHAEGLAFSADLLGETTLGDAEADSFLARYSALVLALSEEANAWPEHPIADRNHLGPLPRAGISLKISSLWSHLDPVNHEQCVQLLLSRVLPLFLLAREKGVSVTLDLEQWKLHGITLDLFEALAMQPTLRDWPHLGIVVQAYLVSAREDVRRLRALAHSRGAPICVRLVKGAYWEYEVAHARQHGLPCPVLIGKARTDQSFETLSVDLLRTPDLLLAGFGSHNVRSIACALAAARERGLPDNALEVQILLGMAEPQRDALRDLGFRVRVYSPIGELLPGVAYLVRRLLESTANAGFLRMTWHDNRDPVLLLAKPTGPLEEGPTGGLVKGDLHSVFENCPSADFTDPRVRALYRGAVGSTPAGFPEKVPVAVNGEQRDDGPCIERVCPSDPALRVSRVVLATLDDVQRSVDAAFEAWPAWRDREIADRAALLERLADRLDADRPALAALECFEVGKPVREADADVSEAIDFCRYYARMAMRELAPRRLADIPGEENLLRWEGRGPTAVIAPWNFPLAILCGMSAAALVAGNPVIMKPAEQSSAAAWRLYRHMIGAGFPPGVIQFLPGRGEETGAALVAHPRIAQVAFTGSRAVGLAIWEQAGRVAPGQAWLKRAVCEMGGKNAVIVDEDADIDEAVAGVLHSAFGYAGQKCSACSRVIVVGGSFDAFARRLADAARSLVPAPAHEPRCELGPVIDKEAWQRLRAVIADPGPGAEAIVTASAPSGGFFVPPALFLVGDTAHRLMQEELFGPIVALLRVTGFDEALEAAAATDYALTAGVYSRSPSHIAEARGRLRSGNVYINRGITGAMVGRQPFGGFNMSGGGTKAGGPGYLLQFAQPRSVCENTERRGFVPGMEG